MIDSFARLARERPYDMFTVTEVLEGADVGRSTFYDHYRGKDDLLHSAFAMFHRTMTDCFARELNDEGADDRLEFVLEHFHENRALFRNLTSGSAAHVFARSTERYAALLATHLEARGAAELPVSHVAAMLAQAHFALIRDWLESNPPSPASAAQIARAIRRVNDAALR